MTVIAEPLGPTDHELNVLAETRQATREMEQLNEKLERLLAHAEVLTNLGLEPGEK